MNIKMTIYPDWHEREKLIKVYLELSQRYIKDKIFISTKESDFKQDN